MNSGVPPQPVFVSRRGPPKRACTHEVAQMALTQRTLLSTTFSAGSWLSPQSLSPADHLRAFLLGLGP
jgi:hypothetical protein